MMTLLSNTGLVLDISIAASLVTLVYFALKLFNLIAVKKTPEVKAVLNIG